MSMINTDIDLNKTIPWKILENYREKKMKVDKKISFFYLYCIFVFLIKLKRSDFSYKLVLFHKMLCNFA